MRLILLVAVLLLAAGPASAEEKPLAKPVALKSFALVRGDLVRLGDLFEGLGPAADTAVARAPEPGNRVEFNSRWLSAMAHRHGIPWQPQSSFDHVVLERASHRIGANRIEAVLRDGLADRGLAGSASLQLDNPAQQIVLPAEIEPSLALTGLSYDPGSGRFSARVVAPAEGIARAEAIVTGRAVAMTDVPVLQRQVAPGDTIRSEDIAWIAMPTERLTRNIVLDPGNMIGLSPRRPLAVEQPVRGNDLRQAIAVEKNSLVTIRLQTPRMTLTAQGRTLEDGAEGAVVRVMNTTSNKVLHAVVLDAGTVEVQPPAGLASN